MMHVVTCSNCSSTEYEDEEETEESKEGRLTELLAEAEAREQAAIDDEFVDAADAPSKLNAKLKEIRGERGESKVSLLLGK